MLAAHVSASPGFTLAFVATVAGVATLVVLAHGTARAALAAAAWLAISGAAAQSGWLAFRPFPTIVLLVAPMIALACIAALASPGDRVLARVPLAWLVGCHGFRVPVELLLHRAYLEGLVPIQMTYLGWNFDVLSGASAVVVGVLVARGVVADRGVLVWNIASLALLLNIVAIALGSTPSLLGFIDAQPPNAWIQHAPWIWLPTVLVAAALAGHVLVFRALAARRES